MDGLGDRMKCYEEATSMRLMPLLPAICRLDGRAFHSFCKNLKRPYDKRLSDVMVEVTKYLVEETGAVVGYTQSDEITLVLYRDTFNSQLFFDGRVFKITSVLAAMASTYFCMRLPSAIPEKAGLLPVFDCRTWNVPNKTEATNAVLWREQDATRNSISMAAQSLYNHKELQNKSCDEMQEMLFQKGINWNDYPAFFKRGSYVRKIKIKRPFSKSEIELLPEKHMARQNPELEVDRTDVEVVDMPQLSKIVNREDVLFDGADIIIAE